MKGIFETLPNNITSLRKKVKKTNSNIPEETSNSPNKEESDSKSKRFNIANNPRLAKIIKKISINKLEESNISHKIQNSTISNKNVEILSNALIEEDPNILSNEKGKQFYSNFSDTIMLFKDRPELQNKINTKTEDFNNYINNTEKFFNISQKEFSIFNSYESILNNSNQKGNNDFFADSNVSFKNSFLRNMKNKTDFKNMNLIKNSFSQSTINIPNAQEGIDITKSVKNFHRHSATKNRRNSQNLIISNTLYQKTNQNLVNNNNEIFNIDEEIISMPNDEMQRYKTLNTKILNHLNKEDLKQIKMQKKIELEEIKNKMNKNLKSNLPIGNNENNKLEISSNSSKFEKINLTKFDKEKISEFPTETNKKTYNNLILPNDSETDPKIENTEKISNEFYQSGKITEKGVGDFRVITEIDEKKSPKSNNDYKEIGSNTHETILTITNNQSSNIKESKSEKVQNIGSNKNFFNKIETGTETNNNEEKIYLSPYTAKKENKIYKIIDKKTKEEYEAKRLKWEKMNKANNFEDTEDSMFKTKSIKFKKRETMRKVQKRENHSMTNIPLNNDINLNSGNLNDKRESNLSIMNRLERKRRSDQGSFMNPNDFSYSNKNLVKSISDVYFNNRKSN